MKLLVSGWASWGVLDTESGAYTPVHEGEGPYYGITFDKERIYVMAHAGGARPHIQVYDAALKGLEGIYPTVALDDTHQMVLHAGCIYVTCTGKNRIAIYDLTERTWDVWYPGEVRDIDHNHFNSIFFDHQILVLAHNQPGRVTDDPRRQSEVWIFTQQDECLARIPVGFGAHSVWRSEGELFVLDSQAGRISGIRPAVWNNSNCDIVVGTQVHVGGFLRGAVMTKDVRAVGSCPRAEVRESREALESHVHVFNAKWERLAKLPAEGLGPICDIRAPGVPDACHGHETGPVLR